MANRFGSRAIVYVAATVGTSGAFEWRWTLDDAQNALCDIASDGDDTRLVAVLVPGGLTADGITRWLDARPELWEPRGARYPRTDAHGNTIWACCDSVIGELCEHRSPVNRPNH